MQTVILAAGRGERLRPLTDTLPKPLIKIGEKTLIEYSLDNLKKIGITEVIIITGFLENLIKEKIGNSYQGINLFYVSNKEYSTTGSMYSLSRAEEMITEDILLLESDLLYEPKALKLLIDSSELDLVLVAPLSGSGDEVFISVDKSDKLVDLGKEIKEKDGACGELAGITKLSLPFLKKLFETAREDYKQNETKYHYEETIFKLSKTYAVKCLMNKNLNWIEIDTENDLRQAKNVIFPRIIKKIKLKKQL